MGCRYAALTDEWHGWKCTVTGGQCAFLIPSEGACYEKYEEGPLANENGGENGEKEE